MARKSASTLFPRGLATGSAFCNRARERKQLSDHILQGTHTWVIGRRRYGKSSLVAKVLNELARKRSPKLHSETVDCLSVHSFEHLEDLLRTAIGKLAAQCLPKRQRSLGVVGKALAALKPELSLTGGGFSISLTAKQTAPAGIAELLEGLDAAAVAAKRRVVLVIDEFQQVGQLKEGRAIEGAIRTVAQRTKALSLVFSGSERTLLASMFEDESRPLWRLCYRLEVERITKAHHEKFISEAATLTWNKPVAGDAIDAILEATDRHPYYVNMLCQAVFAEKKPPSVKTVALHWEELLGRERNFAVSMIQSLSQQQRNALTVLARHKTQEPMSQAYLGIAGLAASTMRQSLGVLMDKDMVRRSEENEYEIVDPLIRSILRQTS